MKNIKFTVNKSTEYKNISSVTEVNLININFK